MDQATLNLLGTLFGFIASVAGAVAAVIGLRNRFINQEAGKAAKAAEQQAATAAAKSTATNDSITEGVRTMDAAVRALETVRDSYDDLMAAYVKQKALENKVQIIGEYLADREKERIARTTAEQFQEGNPT